MGCRVESPKREMLRIVRASDGTVKVDPSGRHPGRGAYVCYSEKCLTAAKSRDSLSKALKTKVDASVYDQILGVIREKEKEAQISGE